MIIGKGFDGLNGLVTCEYGHGPLSGSTNLIVKINRVELGDQIFGGHKYFNNVFTLFLATYD